MQLQLYTNIYFRFVRTLRSTNKKNEKEEEKDAAFFNGLKQKR